MLIKLTFLTIFLYQIFSVTTSSSIPCTLICLNQTHTLPKPPVFYINDTINDALIIFSINCNTTDNLTYANVSISYDNQNSIEIKNTLPLKLLPFNNDVQNLTFNLTIHGKLLGYSRLSLHVDYLNQTNYTFNYTNNLDVDFAVKRKGTILDIIFTVIVIILVCIGTFLIGCRLDTQNLYANIRRPVPILIGLSSQFLCLPLLAFGLAKLAKLDSSTAIGLISTGSAPGGGASNMYTAMYGGDVDLSASMTFSSTILAFGTFPLWILLLGREFIDTHNVHFPWENMFATLICLIVPAGIGLVLRAQKPRIADRFTRYLRFLTLFFIVYILTFGIYTNLYIFKLINYRTLIVSVILPYTGFLIGFLMSIITRQSRERLIAIFIESGLQNTGVAIFFLRLSLPQPDSDLAIVVPIFVAIAIPLPLLIIYGFMSIHRYYKKRHNLVTSINDEERDRADYEPLPTNTIRRVHERDIFNITGELQFCPSSIIVRNVSITNPLLKRLSILNVTYLIEPNRINISGLARLIGFAPLTVQLYFQDTNEYRSTERSKRNATIEEITCARSSSDRMEILQKCPKLKYEDDHYILSHTINIAVKRHQSVIDALFTAVVIVLVTAGTLCIGCGLEMEQLLTNFRRPLPLIIGLTCQIVYVPLLSIAISKTVRLDNSTTLGLFSTACSPGGGSSNIYTALLAGDIDLSVTMTFISTALAFGTFPLWMGLLGKHYVDFSQAKFPWWSMFLSLITLFLPVSTGFLLRRYRPVVAHRIGRFLNPIAVGYLVFILTFGVYINMYIFYIIDFKAIMACCFLPWFGFIGGAIISLIGVRDRKKTIAICIETGIQNTAVAIFFLRLTFPQPDSDVALANPILVSMATPIPFLVLVLTRSIMKRFTCCQKFLPKKQKQKIMENGTKEESPEKTLIKELLEETKTEEKQEQSGQIA
ncbi:unnamed protein product [Adineta steineri]|uniref:Uncharacterized protein n=1 Tax=Adineta steineri TaxID=433720 RepID=A0A815HCX1_9BILA|nr:unnamed protein product [Adineta steineri]CAF1429908.1 unnamed protein product [Adineta steineri]CAF3758401.1 unnamed protein product [Adineta steineri]